MAEEIHNHHSKYKKKPVGHFKIWLFMSDQLTELDWGSF